MKKITSLIYNKFQYKMEDSSDWKRLGAIIKMFGTEIVLEAIDDIEYHGQGLNHLFAMITIECKHIINETDIDFEKL